MLTNLRLKKNTFPLDNLTDMLTTKEIVNFKNHKINNITNNSKEVETNSLFVAIKGFEVDGHDYILEAIKAGAVAIIGEKKIEVPNHITYIRVNNSRQALAKLVAKFYDYPSQRLRLIGVTGTAGKTTTTAMIDSITNQVVDQTGLIGTLHTKIGDQYYSNPNKCTTPNALILNGILTEMKQRGIDYVNMEVSSHALKLDRVWGMDFDIGIFTNLSYDHLEFHNTLEDYYQSKEKLFTSLSKDKFAILNIDDKVTKTLIKNTPANCYTYGIKNKADITAENIELKKEGLKFDLSINKRIMTSLGNVIRPTSIKINLSVLGYHNIYNALAAFTAGLILGFNIDKIKKGLKKFSGVRRRLELIYEDEFTIIDDFAHNPASLIANFETIENFNYNELIIIHFLKGKRGIKANQRNARLISKWAKRLNLKEIITTRAEEEVINKNRVLSEEEEAFTEVINQTKINITNTNTLISAIKLGLKRVKKDSLLVLVGGPGLDRGRKIIKDLLQG